MLQRERRLDEAGHPGSRIEVPEIGFERAEAAVARVRRVAPESHRQRCDLDGIAERRRRAVCLDVPNAACRHAGQRLCGGNDLGLALDTGRRVAGLVRPIVVDGDAPDHRVHSVAVGERPRQGLQHHNARARARTRAARTDIERPAVPVGREDHPFLVQVTRAQRKSDGYATGERHVAFTALEGTAGYLHGDQRCRARGLDGHAGSAEVELVGHPRTQEILVVAQHQLIAADRFDQRRIAQQLRVQVRVHARSGIHAHRFRQRVRCVACVFQSFPGAFQEDPLLGVEHLCLARREAEEAGVEPLGLLEEGATFHILRVSTHRGGHASRFEVARRSKCRGTPRPRRSRARRPRARRRPESGRPCRRWRSRAMACS